MFSKEMIITNEPTTTFGKVSVIGVTHMQTHEYEHAVVNVLLD